MAATDFLVGKQERRVAKGEERCSKAALSGPNAVDDGC